MMDEDRSYQSYDTISSFPTLFECVFCTAGRGGSPEDFLLLFNLILYCLSQRRAAASCVRLTSSEVSNSAGRPDRIQYML